MVVPRLLYRWYGETGTLFSKAFSDRAQVGTRVVLPRSAVDFWTWRRLDP